MVKSTQEARTVSLMGCGRGEPLEPLAIGKALVFALVALQVGLFFLFFKVD